MIHVDIKEWFSVMATYFTLFLFHILLSIVVFLLLANDFLSNLKNAQGS